MSLLEVYFSGLASPGSSSPELGTPELPSPETSIKETLSHVSLYELGQDFERPVEDQEVVDKPFTGLPVGGKMSGTFASAPMSYCNSFYGRGLAEEEDEDVFEDAVERRPAPIGARDAPEPSNEPYDHIFSMIPPRRPRRTPILLPDNCSRDAARSHDIPDTAEAPEVVRVRGRDIEFALPKDTPVKFRETNFSGSSATSPGHGSDAMQHGRSHGVKTSENDHIVATLDVLLRDVQDMKSQQSQRYEVSSL